MRLLDRYLFRELLVPLGYCLCGFLMLSIFSDLFASLNDFQSKKMVFHDIVAYYLVATPGLLVVVLPVALLLALLYTLTNLARHHEITAIRAAGISLWRLCVPYVAVGLAATAALFVLNEFCVPDSADAADQIKSRHVPRAPGTLPRGYYPNLGFVNHRDDRQWKFQLYNSTTGEMTNLTVLWKVSDGSSRWLQAKRAVHTNGFWTFFGLAEYRVDPDAASQPTPILTTNQLAFRQFLETPEQMNSYLKLTTGTTLFGARKSDIPIKVIYDYLRYYPNPQRAERDLLYTKLYGRFATPWTCLVVVLIAIPFGAASGRRNVFYGVAGSLLICFIYFVLQQVALTLGTSGRMPAWLAAWSPNMAFGLTGLLLMARVR